MSPAHIQVENLQKSFGDVKAVNDISFSVRKNECVGLLGGNGAGKTTTIGMILGLILPTAGSVSILGHSIAKDRFNVLGRMNFISPYLDMPFRLTVRQNLTVYGKLYGVVGLEDKISTLAHDLDLKEILDRPNGKLSAGQKTRVGLAKALINSPDVLLLDEPTASLDPDTADWIRTHLENYQKSQNAAILLASHNMPEVERLCDRVILMKSGQIVADDTPAEIISSFKKSNLEEVFLAIARQDRQ